MEALAQVSGSRPIGFQGLGFRVRCLLQVLGLGSHMAAAVGLGV